MRAKTAEMLAASNAANEAILRSSSHEELYQGICDAVTIGRKFIKTAAFIAMTRNGLGYVTGAGEMIDALSRLETSSDKNSGQHQDIVTVAFSSGRSCIVNDFSRDERVQAWRDEGMRVGIGAAAAVPIVKNKSTVGVFLLFVAEPNSIDDEIVRLIERLVENISLASDKFAREVEEDRITCMVSALSATNEAILRAETREKLYKLVCDAAVLGGKFTNTTIALADPKSDFLDIVASTGPSAEASRKIKLATTTAHPEGRGLSGMAFRTRQPCISNDYHADERFSMFHDAVLRMGAKSGGALPLLSRGKAIGILLFMSAERNTFTPEFVELLRRLGGNVSFALENFDREDERVQAEERIQYLATHDSLTDLPNRAKFNELLHFSLKTATRYERQCAVLFVDLDRFKVINDSLGHAAGDILLVEMANRLRNGVRACDVVARLGGDEFVILLNEITESQQVSVIARKLLSALSRPLKLSGHEYRVSGSIGIAMFPDDGTDELTLMKNADIAMYLAKEAGKNDIRFFSNEIKAQSTGRLMMESDLRRALDRNEFFLYYQPKLDVATGQIAGVEAFLHWTHPDLGVLPHTRFIPLAEETGLIVPIGRWVLKTACTQNMTWQHEGLPPLSMAINISPRQFSDANLLQDIDGALAVSGMDPKLLQLEITESMIMLNVERATQVLELIQGRGVRLAIDDFGVGYSSMAMMKRVPIDTIKIDRSFVRDLPHNSENKAIAKAIIGMGKALGLTIVAEGVETNEQDEFLRNNACDEIQGFLFSKPVAASKIAEFVHLPPISAPPIQSSGAVLTKEEQHADFNTRARTARP